MDFLPLASITADRAVRRHFDGGRVDSSPAAAHRGAHEVNESTTTVASTHRGAAAIRASVAGLLYRGARAVEPCGYRSPAAH